MPSPSHLQLPKLLAATVLLLLSACAPQTKISPANSRAAVPAPDRIVCRYNGKPYTVHDLTGVTDTQVKQILANTARQYDLAQYPPLRQGFFNPGMDIWKPSSTPTLEDFYNHQLNGVLEKFIAARVMELFSQRYPVDIHPYFRPELLAAVTADYANREQRSLDAIDAGLTAGTPQALAADLTAAFPHSPYYLAQTPAQWAALYTQLHPTLPYQKINALCFPTFKDGRPTPWFVDQMHTLFRYYIQAEIERDRPKYIAMVENEWGRINYCLIENATIDELPALKQAITDTCKPDGSFVEPKLFRARFAPLHAANEALVVHLAFSNRRMLSQSHLLPIEDLKIDQFIPVPSDKNPTPDYLYIFQKTPTPHFQTYPAAPGNFTYDVVHTNLVKPLIQQVLASLEPGPGLTLPTTEKLLNISTREDPLPDPDYIKNFYGDPIIPILQSPAH